MAKPGRLSGRWCLTDCTSQYCLAGHTGVRPAIGLLEVVRRLGPLFPKSSERKAAWLLNGRSWRFCPNGPSVPWARRMHEEGLRARPQLLQHDACHGGAVLLQRARCNDMRRHKRQLRSRPVGRGKQAAALQGAILYSSGFLVTACSSSSSGSASSTKWCLVRNGRPFSGSTAEVSQQ